ncbi:hypothetical protein F4803DRAFT_555865 [Xylaria telfairii]|nr:hypothetical protein F4803DRAFT_555865 [Xylaria telfairii]
MSLTKYLVVIWWLFSQNLVAPFNLYPGVDPNKLATSMNITSACIQALNQTILECDQTLLQMTQNLENYWWTDDNLTAICSPNSETGLSCMDSVTNWNGDSASACDEQYFTAYGSLVPIWTVTERFRDSISFACLESWSDDYAWCLTESQEWVGADVLRADCDTNPSDPTCSGNVTDIPESSIRMANLYSDDILCNNCFINQLYARVTSEFLPDSDHSDYLIDQLFDIQDICNVSLPEFTVRLPIFYDTAPPLTSVDLGTPTSSAPPVATTCVGQQVGGSISTNTKRSWFGSITKVQIRQDPESCDSLSLQYGVATGALQWFTDSDTCDVSGGACLPAPCKLQQVADGDSCTSIAASIGAANSTTLAQFLKWNSYVLGLCDSLTAGQYVCVTSPGTTGSFSLPPPPLGTDADSGNQQRGGPGGVVIPTTTITSTVNPVSGGVVPSPTQDGLVTNCNNYATAKSGQGCYDFATSNNIMPSQLYAWNPVLGLDGIDCTTALWASEYYCIGTQQPTSTTITAPGPTQSGIVSNCDKYAVAMSGDSCSDFASRNEITNAELFAWNPVLGSKGENCANSLWVGEYYCVGISPGQISTSTTTTTTPTSITAPGPTQSGIVANCDKYAAAVAGDTCSAFATRNSITTTDFWTWNPILGANGENCATNLWSGEYYCVGVAPVPPPGPTQPGIASNCSKYAAAVAGDTCSAFISRNGVTASKFYQWNPVLGSAGENCSSDLWAGEYYCIGIGS